MASPLAPIAPVWSAPAPPAGLPPPEPPAARPAAGRLYVLHVTLWDLHAARALRARLLAAAVASDAVRVRGRRTDDGLQEAQVRPRHLLTTRWRLNVAIVATAAVVVGPPVGAFLATFTFGEHVVVAWAGAAVGVVGLAVVGVTAVRADHLQLRPGSRHDTRIEGHLAVSGAGVVRAEMLLAMTPDLMAVQRLPEGSDPLGW